MKGIVQIMRLDSSLLAGIYTLLGSYLGGVEVTGLLAPSALTAAGVVVCIVGYSFVVNDICDRWNDAQFRPTRAIPAGNIGLESARLLAIGLAATGLLLASSLGAFLFLFALGSILLGTVYSLYLKGTPLWGNGSIALLNASILLYGALAAGIVSPVVLTAAGLTFCFTLAQEILYTVHDREGDRRMGLNTTALYFGTPGSIRLMQGLALLLSLVGILPWLLGFASLLYLLSIALITLLPTGLTVVYLWRYHHRTALVRAARIFWFVRLASLIPLVVLR